MPHIRDFEPAFAGSFPEVKKALPLYERAVRERRGLVVFISAELGGGKTECLNAIAKALHGATPRPNFIAGSFINDVYHPYLLDQQEHFSFKKSIVAASEVASLLSLIPSPWAFAAELVGQIIATSASALEFVNESSKEPSDARESADWLKKLLRSAVKDKPLIALVDNWDEAPRFVWDSMLLGFSREIARDLPLLLFITVKEPKKGDESGLSEVLKSLTEKGLALRWPLTKLTPDQVAALIGTASPGIAAKLHGVTAGNARWTRELWREWRLNEIVVTDQADRWVWGEKHDASINLYDDILRDRLEKLLEARTALEIDEVREVLACAALEGVEFTADALALALNQDRDELIDFIDEILVQSDARPDGLLIETDSATITKPDGTQRTLWRYRFVSDLHWMALNRYGFSTTERPHLNDSEKGEMTAAMVRALTESYAPELRLAARSLARLSADIGWKSDAAHFQRMSNYLTGREAMREYALHLVAVKKEHWEPWERGRAASFLVEAGNLMFDFFPHAETLAVIQEAQKLAGMVRNRNDEARAHYLSGAIFHAEGEYESARHSGAAALEIYRRLGRRIQTAHVLRLLGMVECNQGNLEKARDLMLESVNICRAGSNRFGLANSLRGLADIEYEDRNYTKAEELVTEALTIFRQIGDRLEESASLTFLAMIRSRWGNYGEVRELAEAALRTKKEIGNAHAVAVSLLSLAEIELGERHYAEARSFAQQALAIHDELGEREDLTLSLRVLAHAAYGERNYAEAVERASQMLEICQAMGFLFGILDSLELLGRVALIVNRPTQAFVLKILGILIQMNVEDSPMKSFGKISVKMFSDSGNAGESELYNQVLDAYEKDSGKELIERSLASLREAVG